MRSALLVCDRAALLKHLRQHFAINWHGDHGASHWARVRNNGLMIAAATGANTAVVELFAFFHDSCRVNEYTDHDHGKRGADLAVKPQGRLFDASSDGFTKTDNGVQARWDADRLDLGRVSIEHHPKFLCTEAKQVNYESGLPTKPPIGVCVTFPRSRWLVAA